MSKLKTQLAAATNPQSTGAIKPELTIDQLDIIGECHLLLQVLLSMTNGKNEKVQVYWVEIKTGFSFVATMLHLHCLLIACKIIR